MVIPQAKYTIGQSGLRQSLYDGRPSLWASTEVFAMDPTVANETLSAFSLQCGQRSSSVSLSGTVQQSEDITFICGDPRHLYWSAIHKKRGANKSVAQERECNPDMGL